MVLELLKALPSLRIESSGLIAVVLGLNILRSINFFSEEKVLDIIRRDASFTRTKDDAGHIFSD